MKDVENTDRRIALSLESAVALSLFGRPAYTREEHAEVRAWIVRLDAACA